MRGRPHPAGHRRARPAGPVALARGPGPQLGPARGGLRPGALPAVARRLAAALRGRRPAARARRRDPPGRPRCRCHRDRGASGRRRPVRGRTGARRGLLDRLRSCQGDARDHLPPTGGGRRRQVPARTPARPHVAPQHRLRRGRAGVHQVPPQRRPLDLVASGAPGRGRRAAVGLRLGLPARRRRGQRRRRHAGHRQAPGRRQPARAALALRGVAARDVAARGRRACALVGAAAHGRRGERGGRPQLAARRRRGRLREPAQRRGHRLRTGDRAPRGADCSRGRSPMRTWTTRGSGRRSCGTSTARRSPSPDGWPGC